ncbi:MAG: hypothetical protein KGL48_07085 [Sphingomonadales bacterium]|nr:hypothetical protein [Sphingomonadales bacterium]MDE2569745.1 hypothetical protein [Sphingomonadales bacterium]
MTRSPSWRRAGTASIAVVLLTLGACQRAPAPDAEASGDPLDAVRVDMPAPGATQSPHPSDEKPEWRAMTDGGAGFGYAGERPLLSLACRSGLVEVTRNIAAPVGAQAMFALIGSGKILRLPVDAIGDPAGGGGYVWRGHLAPDDPANEVFTGGRFTATLPGGGEIEVAGSPLESAVIAGCRSKPATAAPTSTTAPE